MSRVAFIQCIYDTFEGTMCLASVLERQGHDVDLVIEPSPGKVVEHLRRRPPDIAAFSSITGQHGWVIRVSRLLRSSGFGGIIVAGGPHPTFFPEMAGEPSIDCVCRGEGEQALPELCTTGCEPGSFRSINNLCYMRDGELVSNPLNHLLADLDTLPFPDRDLYFARYPVLATNPVKHFMSSRGCPHECRFCYNKQYRELYRGKGRYLRRKSPAYFLDEIRTSLDRYGAGQIRFQDDDFIADRGWLEGFLAGYRARIALPFSCYIRIDNLTEDIALQLKESACRLLVFSVETGNEERRNQLLGKRLSDDDIGRGAEICHLYGLPFVIGNMVGLPGETLDDAWQTVRFNRRLKPLFSICSVFQPYPSTDIGVQLIESGTISRPDIDAMPLLYHRDSVIRQKDIDEIVNLHKFFDLAVKLEHLDELIRQLVRLPGNRLFTLVHHLSYLGWYRGHSGNSLPFILSSFLTLRRALAEISNE